VTTRPRNLRLAISLGVAAAAVYVGYIVLRLLERGG
jgi:hypothetical protein